jgi:hypothetical protein
MAPNLKVFPDVLKSHVDALAALALTAEKAAK